MKHIKVKKEGHICWVYLNRPKSLNALNTEILKELTEFNASLRGDLESRVIIYTGKGDNFSSGADLKEKRVPVTCDFRIASETAVLGYPEINLGINLNWLGLPLAVRLIGPAKAKKIVISGENENANTLLSWGFYDEVHPKERLMEAANEMANLYASKPPIAAQMIKRSVNELTYSGDDAIMHMDYDQTLLTHETKDRKEAIKSFFEKRDPEYKGD